MVTKEFPPNIYGGAGVHAAELARVLSTLVDLKVHAFGTNPPADYYAGTVDFTPTPASMRGANPVSQTLAVDLQILGALEGTDLIHSHTWYANFAGLSGAKLYGVPHVVTAHSLEPLRPWKAEQLGGGYRLSSWIEREAYRNADAVIAVSEGMRRDILRVYPEMDPAKVHTIYNGIDTERFHPVKNDGDLAALGVDPRLPSVVFVGRITRQKGVPYLLKAARELDPEVQLVLCAGAADTPELAAEVAGLIEELRATRSNVVLIERMLSHEELLTVLSHATVFACPSIYEPLGIVNLEAMACGAPVVATATGGIPEVVVDGVTGLLVPIEQADDGTGTPVDETTFVADFAAALNSVLGDPAMASRMGEAGMKRAAEDFSWEAIGEQTVNLYASLTP